MSFDDEGCLDPYKAATAVKKAIDGCLAGDWHIYAHHLAFERNLVPIVLQHCERISPRGKKVFKFVCVAFDCFVMNLYVSNHLHLCTLAPGYAFVFFSSAFLKN